MANADRPQGFSPIRTMSGGEIRTNAVAPKYTVTAGQTIRIGDPLMRISAGTISVATANIGLAYVGISGSYVDDSASAGGKTVLIYDQPDLVLKVQSTTGGSPALTNEGNCADFVVNTATGRYSNAELSGTMGTGTANFMILGLHDTPNNVYGEHADLEVIAVEHLYKGYGQGGI